MTLESITPAVRRSLAVFPDGSNGEFNLPPELAIVIQRGEGCALWDSAGRRYLDFSMGWGSALVGHANPTVTEAVVRQAPLGANFAYVTENALALAEEIRRLSPACERLRFCASGTEATMYCQRLARAFTGRTKILKFEGAYHGANEIGVTSLFPRRLMDFPRPEPSSAGIEPMVAEHVLVAPFNDLATTRAIAERHAAELAAVIVEPLHRCLPPVDGFLAGLRDIATECGTLLIFDEVVTGFRLAYGGAQAYYSAAGPRSWSWCARAARPRPTMSGWPRRWAATRSRPRPAWPHSRCSGGPARISACTPSAVGSGTACARCWPSAARRRR
jgi:glutamate-1-semialdehyde 2,1-aminomutase